MQKFFIALFLLLLTACSSTKQKTGQTLLLGGKPISLDETSQLIASELFDTITYIPLETNDTLLLGYIEHPKLTSRGIYFISDRSLYLYDLDTGKDLLKIARQGNGPEEYRSLADAWIDAHSGHVELLDNNRKQILVYDSVGNFLHTLPLPSMPFAFAKDEKGTYWFYNNNQMTDFSRSKVVHYNVTSGKVLGEYFPIDPHLADYFYIMDANNFAATKEGIYYMASPSDTIYQLGSDVTPAYALGLDNYKVPDSFWQANYADIMDFVTKANSRDYVYSMANFSLNKDAVMAAFIWKENLYWSFSYLSEKEIHAAHYVHDDFHFTKAFELSSESIPFVMGEDYLYGFLPAEQFMEWCREYAKAPDMQELIKQYGLDEQANPILMKCKLK